MKNINSHGFTLVELILSMAAIIVLGAAILPASLQIKKSISALSSQREKALVIQRLGKHLLNAPQIFQMDWNSMSEGTSISSVCSSLRNLPMAFKGQDLVRASECPDIKDLTQEQCTGRVGWVIQPHPDKNAFGNLMIATVHYENGTLLKGDILQCGNINYENRMQIQLILTAR